LIDVRQDSRGEAPNQQAADFGRHVWTDFVRGVAALLATQALRGGWDEMGAASGSHLPYELK